MLVPEYDLRNLVQVPADNLGGVEACVWYTLAANLVNFPATGELVIRDSLQLKPGTTWYQALSVRRTVRYKQTPKAQGRHGDLYQQRLTGTLARHTPELAQGLEALEGQELVVLYRDLNGHVQLLGTPEQPVSWTDVYDSGTADFTNRNNYDWTLAADTVRRARPYLGTWQVAGGGLQAGIELGAGAGGTVTIRNRAGQVVATVQAGQTVVLRSGFRVAFSIF
ncbi:hypothetical protein Q5H93_12350 [Hymenobacter sp. ASUV-10]|uniref:Uncharacterized protein n=1 Tax=Hymenobacter aranciens TaxID=3063996 RepID=A0ABT9BB84_9BACT|nr:hypothetical protein [Hymenobacter sp. ASUV-10]MDO7875526.1 hypothetical protein [Hymenobacter sp. ASUV-10]